MLIGHREGLSQVHSISIYLQQREDITAPHCIVQASQFGTRICTSVLSKALVDVLSGDEIFAALPDGLRKYFGNKRLTRELFKNSLVNVLSIKNINKN